MLKKFVLLTVILMAACVFTGVAMAGEGATCADPAAAPAMAEASASTAMAGEAAAPVVVGNKVCPVTGMAIAEADMGANTVEFEGKVYNLCCGDCKEKFLADPKAMMAKVDAEMAKTEAPAEM